MYVCMICFSQSGEDGDRKKLQLQISQSAHTAEIMNLLFVSGYSMCRCNCCKRISLSLNILVQLASQPPAYQVGLHAIHTVCISVFVHKA